MPRTKHVTVPILSPPVHVGVSTVWARLMWFCLTIATFTLLANTRVITTLISTSTMMLSLLTETASGYSATRNLSLRSPIFTPLPPYLQSHKSPIHNQSGSLP